MLYFNALRIGLNELPIADAHVRGDLDELAAQVGWPALHAKLAQIDPQSAGRIHPNDVQRIQRALEVFRVTGVRLSAHLAQPREVVRTHRLIEMALMPTNRPRLHERIATRFDQMLSQGLLNELTLLRQRFDLDEKMNSMRCVGYRQAWEHLEQRTSHAQFREKGIAATRQLAKRQVTWLRAMPAVKRLDPFASDLLGEATAYVAARLR